jgi:hypothetical protein
MSSSDDDTPLVRGKPEGECTARIALVQARHGYLPLTRRLPLSSSTSPFNSLLARNPTISLQLAQTQPLNMADHPPTAKSNERISPEDVKKMDAEVPHTDHVEPGISIRMGPVDAEDKMDVDAPETNGNTNGKRKARSSITNGKSYKDVSSSEEDDKPLVRISQGPLRAVAPY